MRLKHLEGNIFTFHCPACNIDHKIDITKWSFNGDFNYPSFIPSIRVTIGPKCDPVTKLRLDDKDLICHSFVTNGRINFLGDCTHKLANLSKELPYYT